MISRLTQTLADFSWSMSSPPFNAFLKSLIRIYLNRILGSEDAVPILKTPSIACSTGFICQDCQLPDKFLNNTDPHRFFTINQQRRSHLEGQIRAHPRVAKIVTTETIMGGSPYTLVVRKTKEVMERYTWDGRQAAARTFLRTIGDDRVLCGILGMELFGEACRALNTHQTRA